MAPQRNGGVASRFKATVLKPSTEQVHEFDPIAPPYLVPTSPDIRLCRFCFQNWLLSIWSFRLFRSFSQPCPFRSTGSTSTHLRMWLSSTDSFRPFSAVLHYRMSWPSRMLDQRGYIDRPCRTDCLPGTPKKLRTTSSRTTRAHCLYLRREKISGVVGETSYCSFLSGYGQNRRRRGVGSKCKRGLGWAPPWEDPGHETQSARGQQHHTAAATIRLRYHRAEHRTASGCSCEMADCTDATTHAPGAFRLIRYGEATQVRPCHWHTTQAKPRPPAKWPARHTRPAKEPTTVPQRPPAPAQHQGANG